MFNQVSYTVLIERLRAFADGHYLIKSFTHGMPDAKDITKSSVFPWMHVVPKSVTPSAGSRAYSIDVIFADLPRNKAEKQDNEKEVVSDCIRLCEDLLAEVQNGYTIFGTDVEITGTPNIEPFISDFANSLSGAVLSIELTFPWNWSACDIPADWSVGGSGSSGGSQVPSALVLKVNGVDNTVQDLLDIVNGTNTTIEDLGDGRVRINSSGGVSSVSWGDIIGNIADQLDLAMWFNEKADITSLAEVAFTGDYNDLQNLPTIPASQIQSDWNQSNNTSLDFIKNKPTIPSPQVNSDWNAISGVEEILNKPTIPTELRDLTDVNIIGPLQNDTLLFDTPSNQFINGQLGAVAYSNDYNDLDNIPSIPPVIGDMTKSVYDTDNDGIVDSAERVQIVVRNSTGSTLLKGQVVYLSGATGNRPNAVLADASTEATSSKTIGLVMANIANNADGNVAVNGTLHDLDTSSFTDGATLWLSETAGAMQQNTPPAEPAHAVFIGYVARSHPNLGRIVLAIQNGYELDELHGVQIVSPLQKNLLSYNSASGLWENKAIDSTWMSDRTAVGGGLIGLSNPSAISYIRINADNSVTTRTPAQVLSDLGISANIILGRDFTGLTVSNTTTNTVAFSALIPANTLQASDFIELISQFQSTVGNGVSIIWRTYLNTTPNVGGTLLATWQNAVGTGNTGFLRNIFVTAVGASGNLRITGTGNIVSNPYVFNSAVINNVAINTTIDQYIVIGVQMGNAVSTATILGTLLKLTR